MNAHLDHPLEGVKVCVEKSNRKVLVWRTRLLVVRAGDARSGPCDKFTNSLGILSLNSYSLLNVAKELDSHPLKWIWWLEVTKCMMRFTDHPRVYCLRLQNEASLSGHPIIQGVHATWAAKHKWKTLVVRNSAD
jgi:hypothetical protein